MIGIRHIGITVCDLEKMKSFYQNLLGFTIVKEALERGEYINNFYKMKGVEVITVKMKDSRNSGVLLELLQYKSHPPGQAEEQPRPVVLPGISHYALTVKNIDEIYKQLIEAGIVFNCVPQVSPDGKARISFCLDPENNLIELVEML